MLAPDFLIIGTQKGGTSALFQYLNTHPQVQCPARKELHFFDLFFHRGCQWYESALCPEGFSSGLRGEASPYYLFHPLAPARVAECYPEVKILVILRNPVERAFSHYQMMVSRKLETSSFPEALRAEDRMFDGEEERIRADPAYVSNAHWRFCYRARGFYAIQLRRWFGLLPIRNFLVLFSEDFRAAAFSTMQVVTDFLGIDPLPPATHLAPVFVGSPGRPPGPQAMALARTYSSANRRLAELLVSSGVRLGSYERATWIHSEILRASEIPRSV